MTESGFPQTPFEASGSDRPRDPINDRNESHEIERTGQPRGVLVVEDDFLIAMQAEAALLDAGLEVVGLAATAEEALAMATQQRPALVVMDIRLAGTRDGIEAAGDLFRAFGLRCVFATAHDDQQTRNRAAPYAPLGWLAKPYTMASLVGLVREVLSTQD
ncbi:response regulator [Bradyrhizobium sp. LMG 9283]|uniref:response regulator n=1 Tax=Bradyrhizobium sp. LMG 9283 TaxID=592064 RepID=UPI00388EEB80